jgi:hypothetical protein
MRHCVVTSCGEATAKYEATLEIMGHQPPAAARHWQKRSTVAESE